MSKTTFSPHQITPAGRAMLSCSCLQPDGWMSVPIPEEEYDLDNPSTFIPLLVCMAPYGAVVFSIAARPSFDDGSVQDWAEYLVTQQNLRLEQVREARIDRMPCILVESTMASDAGEMRSRAVFLEDGRRLFTIQALAPDAIWESVRADFDVLLGSFRLEEQHGITAAPMRLMTSDPVLDLSALGTVPSRDRDAHVEEIATPAASAPTADTTDDGAQDDGGQSDDTPAQARDVALAEDAATLDPDHVINARLRDAGAGLVPRVLRIDADEQYAVVGAGAIEAMFHVPFGWHVIDDGRRTLVFDPVGGVQINLNLRPSPSHEITSLLQGIGDELARENPQALFMKLELMGMPCLAVRDLLIDGETLDQAYLARPSHREDLALVCRVTSDRDNMTRAVDTSEVILRSLEHAPMVDPEFAGQPDWWREAVLLERRDRVDEAEQVIQRALDHIGVYSTLAGLHEQRMARLSAEGRDEEARIAKARAIQWLNAYAASATSGGEGAALSLERDERIAALGGEG
jgi:hypothetical protein